MGSIGSITRNQPEIWVEIKLMLQFIKTPIVSLINDGTNR